MGYPVSTIASPSSEFWTSGDIPVLSYGETVNTNVDGDEEIYGLVDLACGGGGYGIPATIPANFSGDRSGDVKSG